MLHWHDFCQAHSIDYSVRLVSHTAIRFCRRDHSSYDNHWFVCVHHTRSQIFATGRWMINVVVPSFKQLVPVVLVFTERKSVVVWGGVSSIVWSIMPMVGPQQRCCDFSTVITALIRWVYVSQSSMGLSSVYDAVAMFCLCYHWRFHCLCVAVIRLCKFRILIKNALFVVSWWFYHPGCDFSSCCWCFVEQDMLLLHACAGQTILLLIYHMFSNWANCCNLQKSIDGVAKLRMIQC